MSKKTMSTSPQRVYDAARYALLGLIAATVINIVLFYLDIDTYFVATVFSAYFSFIILDGEVLGVVIALMILAPFVLAFFLSKKNRIWLIIGLVLVSLDTLFLLYIILSGGLFASFFLDVIVHAFEIVILALGVKNGKAATAEPEALVADGTAVPGEAPVTDTSAVPGEAPVTDASAVPGEAQRAAASAGEGPFKDVVCVIAISEDGQKHSLEAQGVARFYQNELALGTENMGVTMLLGSAFASTKERMRFAYTDIARVYYAKKNERTVRIDLQDGRYAFIVLNRSTREQLTDLFALHGITIEPFVE